MISCPTGFRLERWASASDGDSDTRIQTGAASSSSNDIRDEDASDTQTSEKIISQYATVIRQWTRYGRDGELGPTCQEKAEALAAIESLWCAGECTTQNVTCREYALLLKKTIGITDSLWAPKCVYPSYFGEFFKGRVINGRCSRIRCSLNDRFKNMLAEVREEEATVLEEEDATEQEHADPKRQKLNHDLAKTQGLLKFYKGHASKWEEMYQEVKRKLVQKSTRSVFFEPIHLHRSDFERLFKHVEDLSTPGLGCNCRVYHAQSDQGVPLAIKCLELKTWADYEGSQTEFSTHKRAYAACPLGVVQAHDLFAVHADDVETSSFRSVLPEMMCISTTLCRGGDLAAWLSSSPTVSLQDIARATWILASTFHDLHTAGLNYLDLKPGNIFLVQGDTATLKVGDFGLAEGGSSFGSWGRRTGFSGGTRGYWAPESRPETVRLFFPSRGEHGGHGRIERALLEEVTQLKCPVDGLNVKVQVNTRGVRATLSGLRIREVQRALLSGHVLLDGVSSEYLNPPMFSPKSDCYSFGIMLRNMQQHCREDTRVLNALIESLCRTDPVRRASMKDVLATAFAQSGKLF